MVAPNDGVCEHSLLRKIVRIKQNYTQKEAQKILKEFNVSVEDVNKSTTYYQSDGGLSTLYYLLPNNKRVSSRTKLGVAIKIIKGSRRSAVQVNNRKKVTVYF
jgi:hypothetical protein